MDLPPWTRNRRMRGKAGTCVQELNLSGLKLHPSKQGFYPNDKNVRALRYLRENITGPSCSMQAYMAAGNIGKVLPSLNFEEVAGFP